MKDVTTTLEALEAKGTAMQNLLTFSLHFVIGTMLMGVLVIVALTMGYDTAKPILIAAAAGFVLALPPSWLIARRITHLGKS